MSIPDVGSEWIGLKGRIGAWYLASRLRRLSEILVLGNLRPRFLEVLNLRGDEVVLDAGSGSGFFSLAIAERLPRGRVVCADLSEEMLGRLRCRFERRGLGTRLQLWIGDITSLGFPDEFADLAVSNGVWHELPDPSRAARELLRVLRSGGRAVVTDFRDTPLGKRIGAAHRKTDHGPFSRDELADVLRGAGFADVAGEAIRHWVIAWGRKPEEGMRR